MRLGNVWLVYFTCILLTACGTQPIKPSDKHIQREQGGETNQASSIPQPVKHTIPLPPPAATPKAETYSVVVTNVPAQEILFALARDAKINLDIHAGIQGTATPTPSTRHCHKSLIVSPGRWTCAMSWMGKI